MAVYSHRGILVLIALACSLRAAAAPPDAAPVAWHDSYTTRLEALALLQSLNADLLSHDSATLTLDRWCAAHQLANPSTITAERVHERPEARNGCHSAHSCM